MIISPSIYPVEWDRPSEIRTQFLYRCNSCGQTLMREYLGMVPQVPVHPGAGWVNIFGAWLCPGHKIELVVDGKALSTGGQEP